MLFSRDIGVLSVSTFVAFLSTIVDMNFNLFKAIGALIITRIRDGTYLVVTLPD